MEKMKEVSTNIINLAIRKDFLVHMAESGNTIDFCEYVSRLMNKDKKTIAIKFRDGRWDNFEQEQVVRITGGKHLKEAYRQLSN